MTLTEQEIAFFKEAKRIQELWEPKPGDWFAYPKVGWKVAIVKGRDFAKRRRRIEQVWLPRLDQLREMLEARGYYWVLSGGQETANWCSFGNSATQHQGSKKAPTPSIALGRALIEAMDA